MKVLRKVLIASLSVAALATGAVRAASTVDYSDQWWVPSESGWGAAVLQQSDTLFIDLMVYGADGRPTWLVAAAGLQAGSAQGRTLFLGDLYATNGSYHGAPWNPALVAERKVGTLTFEATAADKATISYTVDGVPVAKSVSRQTWSYGNLGGTYDTVWDMGCSPGPPYLLDWTTSRTRIQHNADNTVTMTVTCPLCWDQFQYELRGTYTQSGHLGRIAVDVMPPAGGSLVISEIAPSSAGFTGRVTGAVTIPGLACRVDNGLIGAALR